MDSEKRRAPGRPRDPDVETRILEATLRHLAASGYSRMSIDDIAVEAGISKPTLYRRWSSKADLATAAVRTLQIREPAVEAGTTVEALTAVLQNFRRSLIRPNGMALVGTVLAEEGHTPELLDLFRERIVAPRRRMVTEILERARERGELRKDSDTSAAVTMLVGAFYAQYLAAGRVPANFAVQVVGTVWSGIRRQPKKAPTGQASPI